MKVWLALVLLLTGVATARADKVRHDALGNEIGRHEKLMDEIEREVVLPVEAKPFVAYSRNYAYEDNETVVAFYIIPKEASKSEARCTTGCKLDTNCPLGYRLCSKQEVRKSNLSVIAWNARMAPVGKREWFWIRGAIPEIADGGGCTQIVIRYKVRTRRLSGGCSAGHM